MEKAQKIIVTDTHFGRYNNSVNFLRSQLLIFDDLINYIKMNEVDRFDLIHLGDIFESRSTISTQISSEVRSLFKELNTLLKSRNKDNRFIFVAGNHDFYSDDSDAINSLDTYIRDWLPEAIVVSKDYWVDGDDIYLPWYWMNDPEKFSSIDLNPYRRIFTHCDCKMFAWGRIPVNCSVYAGHIHQKKSYQNAYSSNPNSILYNLSAPYSLEHGDSNDVNKGFWVIEDTTPKLFENKKSIRYRTFINEQIFNIEDLEDSIKRKDNFRIYISEENKSKMEYVEKLNELRIDIKYCTVIPVSNNIISEAGEIGDVLDIDGTLETVIPSHLKDIFNIIKQEVHEGNYI